MIAVLYNKQVYMKRDRDAIIIFNIFVRGNTRMTGWKERIFLAAVMITAFTCSALCVWHYGLGVQPYYEEELEEPGKSVEGVYWLENGTVVEQLYSNSASYMVGVDTILLETGDGCEGTLYVQLCDAEGNLLAQKREQLQDIEAGEFYPVKFLEEIDVSGYENLMIRIFASDNNNVPGLLALSALGDVEDNIRCSINKEAVSGNLAITYLYGNRQYIGYEWKSNGVKQALAASIALIILFSCLAVYLFINRKKIDFRSLAGAVWHKEGNLKQIFYILWFFCVFLSASVIYKLRNSQSVPLWVYVYIFVIIAATGYCFWKVKKDGRKKEREILNLLHDKGLLVVILLSTLVRIPLFTHIQIWDGTIYYGEVQRLCHDFEYSFAYIWDHFRLAGHYSIVYTFFAALGEFLLPDNMTGVLIVRLVLTNIALICIYKMFRGYWLELSEKEAAIGAMVVSVCPLLMGLFSNISPEHLLVIFTIYLFYAEYKGQTIMKMVWLISIMMTKETGLIIAGGYLVTHICSHLRDTIKYRKKNRVHYFLINPYVFYAAGAGVFMCLYTIKQEGLFAWFNMNHQQGDSIIGDHIGVFSESITPILHKAKLLFILHFEWIPVLIIVFCIARSIIGGKGKLAFPGQIGFLGALVFFILSNFYLAAYSLGRYHIYSAVMIWILAYILLMRTFRHCLKGIIGLGVPSAIIVLLLIQNFYFIDPISNLVFDQYDSGKGKMLATEIEGGNFGDSFTNNFRHTYLYGLVDTMLAEGDYNADTQIVIPYEKDYMYFYAYSGYDTVQKRRIFSVKPDDEKVLTINQIFLDDVLDGFGENISGRGIMYFLPYIDCDEEEYVRRAEQLYNVRKRQELSNWGGTMAYYILDPKG